MPGSEMFRRVALVRTDVSEEPRSSSIRVPRIGKLRSVRRLLVAANVVLSFGRSYLLHHQGDKNSVASYC
jgi:hypothetical protein